MLQNYMLTGRPFYDALLHYGVWGALTCIAAATGASFMPGEWYAALHKPAWTPPNWVFSPVWITLYGAMIVAAGRVSLRSRERLPALLFAAQLVANGLWSWLFFGLQAPGLALIDISILLTLLAFCTRSFFRVDRTAGAIMMLYLIWVAYAWTLNAGILILNPAN